MGKRSKEYEARKYQRRKQKAAAKGEIVVVQLNSALKPNMSTAEVASIMGVHQRTVEHIEWSALQKFANGLELALADVRDSYKEDGCVN